MSDELLQQIHVIQARRQANRQRRLRRSRLDQHRGEIERLREHRVSYADIAAWLREIKHVPVNRSTVCRMVQRWQSDDTRQARERERLQSRYDALLPVDK